MNSSRKELLPGFTIVELLVVIVVIGILAAITIVSFSGVSRRAKEAVIQSEINSATKQLGLYYAEYGAYPSALDGTSKCPTTPYPDTKYCLKFSGDTTFVYNPGLGTAPTSFSLIANDSSGTISQFATNTTNADSVKSFAKALGGSGSDYAWSVIQTNDSGYALTGLTYSFGAGNRDLIIAKYNLSGVVAWAKTWGNTLNDKGQTIIQTNDGGYAITGETQSYGAGNVDMFLAKFDANGSISWSKTWGGINDDWGVSLYQTSDGGYMVIGNTEDYGNGSNENYDMFIAKYDSNGTIAWSRTWGGTSSDWGNSIIPTSDGGYAAAGYSTSFGAGSNDMFVIKFDSSNNVSWARSWGGASDDVGLGLAETNSGGLIVTGETYSYGSNGDIFVAKYDSSGTILWSKTIGGAYEDVAYSVKQVGDGGYYISGEVQTSSYGTSYDAYVMKLDSSGAVSWVKNLGGPGTDRSLSMSMTNDSGLIIAGYTDSVGAGGVDAFIAKYKFDGTITNCSASICSSLSPSATTRSVSSPSLSISYPAQSVSSPSQTVASPTISPTTTNIATLSP